MTHPISRPDQLEHHLDRARLLRSRTMRAGVRRLAGSIAATIVRAFVRPYRLRRVPGCGCEA